MNLQLYSGHPCRCTVEEKLHVGPAKQNLKDAMCSKTRKNEIYEHTTQQANLEQYTAKENLTSLE